MPEDRKPNPLVSFIVLGYNQQDFIAEAIESAFLQSYQPMEIVISDDASSDETYEMMKKMVSDYRGPHKVILNRNESNLGICQHINKALRICSGEWVVHAAGDDISRHDRVSKLVDYASKCPQTKLYISKHAEIDENGNLLYGSWSSREPDNTERGGDNASFWSLEDVVEVSAPHAHGASMMYRREIFEIFGDLPVDCNYEDYILAFRALLIGRCGLIPEPLVKYRKSSSQVTNFHVGSPRVIRQKRISVAMQMYRVSRQLIQDYHVASDRFPGLRDRYCGIKLEEWLMLRLKFMRNVYASVSKPWPARLINLYRVLTSPVEFSPIPRDHVAISVLPKPFYLMFKRSR